MKKIICIVGPSGSGKTTIANVLKREFDIPELVSHTTRERRVGETDGESYHFVTSDVFNTIDMVEKSIYAGNHYGLSKEEISKKLEVEDVVVLVTDIHGMLQVKSTYPDIAHSLFLEVTLEEMKERMMARGDKPENIELRLIKAINDNELENGKLCDFTVRNDILIVAIENILQFIFSKEEA